MQERDFLSLTEPKQRAFRRHKAPLAIAAIGSVIVLGAFHVLPLAALALIAALFVVLTRCLDIEEARGAIEWRILYMIFGMLALGTAMETTGAAHLIASGVTSAVGRFGPGVTPRPTPTPSARGVIALPISRRSERRSISFSGSRPASLFRFSGLSCRSLKGFSGRRSWTRRRRGRFHYRL